MSIPFVARAAQASRIAEALDRARSGAPSLLLVAGDAGVGKTRLLEYATERARAAGARVVVGHCVDFGEVGLPYLPFAEALGELSRAEPGVVEQAVAARPALGRLLPGAEGPSDDADDRLQLFEGLLDVLGSAGSAAHPLVLVLEDLHWADASSRDVLRFLAARLSGQHVLVLGSYRTDDLHRRHPMRPLTAELVRQPRVERVDLHPFAPDEFHAFATAVAGRQLATTSVDRVLERSGGNAYFAVELIEAGPEDDTLPWSLADVVHARLDPLDPAVHRLVQVAAVGGRRVAEPLLRAAVAADGHPGLAAPGAVDEALHDAVAHHVLGEEDHRIAFRHALLAEVVYAELLPGEKSALHRAYLHALRDDPTLGSAAETAAHALQAPDLDTAVAASWEAAAAARDVLAPLERLHHLEVVLRLWVAAPEAVRRLGTDRAGVLRQAAAAAVGAGATDRAMALLRSALEEIGEDPLRAAELHTALARVLLGLERPREARAEAALALSGLTEPSPQRARALSVGARVALDSDNDEEAAAVATEALELARQVGAPDAESDALTTLALLAQQSPQHTEHLLLEALERAKQSDDRITELRTHFNLSMSRYYAGDITGAAKLAAVGNARAEEGGVDWADFAIELKWLAETIRYASGDLTPAPWGTTPILGRESATTVLAAVGMYSAVARGDEDSVDSGNRLMAHWRQDPFSLHVAGGMTVDALTWAGRYDEAVALAGTVMEDLARTWSENYLGGIWHCALALAALADAAEDDRLHGRDPATRFAAGDVFVKRARTTAERGRPRGGTLGPEGRGWLARAEAEHARLHGQEDPELWERAIDEFSVGFRFETARTRWRWAASLLAAGDRAGARDQAAVALAEAEAMGARPLADAVRSLARRGRLELPGMRLGSGDVLTARETEVLALVARGLTNRQIGQRLFVSDKTVSVHVSNLLAKLGAVSRAEAVAIAHQRGLLGQ